MWSLTKPEKLIKSLSKPTASLVQAEILLKPHQNFWSSHLPHSLCSTSVVLLFSRKKQRCLKENKKQSTMQTNQIKENVLKHFLAHKMWDGHVFKTAILFLATGLVISFCWFFQPLKKLEWKYFTDVTIPGNGLSTLTQVNAANSKYLACAFVFFLHRRDYTGWRSVHMKAVRDTGSVLSKTRGALL